MPGRGVDSLLRGSSLGPAVEVLRVEEAIGTSTCDGSHAEGRVTEMLKQKIENIHRDHPNHKCFSLIKEVSQLNLIKKNEKTVADQTSKYSKGENTEMLERSQRQR